MKIPKQELEMARKIVEKLHSNTLRATWYSALYERVAFQKDIGTAFGISFEAWGLQYSSEALLDALVMVLMRIIHGDQENTASLLSLMKVLNYSGVFQFLEEENKKYGRGLPCTLDQFNERINKIKGDHRLKKINTYRHTSIAHQAITLDPKKHVPPKYEDPSKLLEEVRPVVILCQELLRDPSSTQPDPKKQWEAEKMVTTKTADEFWKFAAHLSNQLNP